MPVMRRDLADVLAKQAADFMHYFYEIELDERRRVKLRDEWIVPTLAEHDAGAVEEIERLRAAIRDMKALMPLVKRHADAVVEYADGALDGPGGQ